MQDAPQTADQLTGNPKRNRRPAEVPPSRGRHNAGGDGGKDERKDEKNQADILHCVPPVGKAAWRLISSVLFELASLSDTFLPCVGASNSDQLVFHAVRGFVDLLNLSSVMPPEAKSPNGGNQRRNRRDQLSKFAHWSLDKLTSDPHAVYGRLVVFGAGSIGQWVDRNSVAD